MSHAAGFTGYKPSPSKDINKEILKDNRIDVPSKVGKGFDKRALSIQMQYVGDQYAGYCGYIPHVRAYPVHYSPRHIRNEFEKDRKRPFGDKLS